MTTLEDRIRLLIAEKKRAVTEDDYDTAKQLSFRIRKLKLKAGKQRRAKREGAGSDGAASSSAPTPQSRASTSSGEERVKKPRKRPKAKLFHKDPKPTCSVISSDDEDEDDYATERTSLSLANRGLRMVPLKLAQKHANSCRRLDMTGNKLRTGDNLDCFNQLETLILDRCGLASVEMLPNIPTLRTLWLNHNNCSELNRLAAQLKERFPKLTYLSLLKNPLCPDLYFSRKGNTAQYKKYRRTIVYSLKRLQCLDARQLTKQDHDDAKRNGKFLAAAKPKIDDLNAFGFKPPPEHIIGRQLEEDGVDFEEYPDEENKENPPSSYREVDGGKSSSAFIFKASARILLEQPQGNRFIEDRDL